jgi:hypothetical protein
MIAVQGLWFSIAFQAMQSSKLATPEGQIIETPGCVSCVAFAFTVRMMNFPSCGERSQRIGLVEKSAGGALVQKSKEYIHKRLTLQSLAFKS